MTPDCRPPAAFLRLSTRERRRLIPVPKRNHFQNLSKLPRIKVPVIRTPALHIDIHAFILYIEAYISHTTTRFPKDIPFVLYHFASTSLAYAPASSNP